MQPASSKDYPYTINLPADTHWRSTTQLGLQEYIARYRQNTTMNMLLDSALFYSSQKTGDQLWALVGDFFSFNKERKGSINVNALMDEKLMLLKSRLEATTTEPDIQAKWSARFIVAAALYVYAEHLINFKGRQILMPSNYEIIVPGAAFTRS